MQRCLVLSLLAFTLGAGTPAQLQQLLNPKVASPAPPLTPATFANPPAEVRSMPLWVWNGKLEWPRLAEQLQQFKAQGMGGVFVHPRPGLMTGYPGAGSLAEVLLDGKRAGLIGWQPWRTGFPVTAGKHKLAVRVVPAPRNVSGPFRHPTKPRMRAWPAA